MKLAVLILSIILISNFTFAQVELKGTMGLNLISIPSLEDYINEIYAPSDDQLGSFNTAAIFAVEVGYFLQPDFEASIEVPYQIYSYSTNIAGSGQYDLYYDELLPSVIAYYVISGTGYNFKFGGGLGPRFVFVTEEKKWQGSSVEYTSIGFGGLLIVEGNTILSDNLYANIGLDLRYEINGEPEDQNGNPLYNTVEDENVNFNTFSLGIKLGVSYLIGGSK